MTVGQIVGEGLAVHRPELSSRDREALVLAMPDDVGLSERHGVTRCCSAIRTSSPAASASGWLSQGRWCSSPKVLVLDEPTSALDVSVQQQVLALLAELQGRHGLSYSVHQPRPGRGPRDVAPVMVMKNGEVVEEGEAQALFDAPREAYTKRSAGGGTPRLSGATPTACRSCARRA